MSSVSSRADGSFGGAGFWEQVDGAFYAPSPDDMEDTASLRIPGGNVTVIQAFGQATRTFELPVAVSSAQLSALRAKRGTRGTLICSQGTFTGAFLHGLVKPTKDIIEGDWKVSLRVTV